MEREKTHRPRDRNMRKTLRSETDGGHEDLNFRTERPDLSAAHTPPQSELQSRLAGKETDRSQFNASEHSVRQRERISRNEPVSVNETIVRHKKQARQFTKHAARSDDDNIPAQTVDTAPAEAPAQKNRAQSFDRAEPPPTYDLGIKPDDSLVREKSLQDFNTHADSPDIQRDKTQKLNFRRDDNPITADAADGSVPFKQSDRDIQALSKNSRTSKKSKKRHKKGKKQRQYFDELRKDNADTQIAGPIAASAPQLDMQATSEQFQNQQSEELSVIRQPPMREATLSHEHTPRFMERPGKLLYNKVKKTLANAEKKRSTPTSAAKYTVSEAVKTDNSEAPVNSDELKEKPQPPSDEAEAGASEEKNVQPDSEDTAAEQDLGADDTASAEPDIGSDGRKSGKLKFSEEEKTPATDGAKTDKKLNKARRKAERSGEKLEAAQKKLPKKRRITFDKKIDEKDAGASGTAKPKRKLRFETEVKSQREHIKGSLVTRPVKLGANAAVGYAHKKIYQVEHENVGTQAAHRAELLAEGGLRRAYRLYKTAPYRKVSKLKRKTTKLNIKADYRQALIDNPKLKSNLFSRIAQKHKIKRKYAKAAREAKKAAKRAKRTGGVLGKATAAVARFVARHPAVFGIIAALFLLVIIISSIFTSCSNMASNAGTAIMATSYLAEDAEVDSAELVYTEWETDLQLQLTRVENDRPGYDEYRYNVGDISHNPYELMAFLTAVYHDFSDADVEAVLQEIFAEQYSLTYTPSVETRYREGVDGAQEAYEWRVLTVTLTARSFADVVSGRMSTEERQIYTLLMQSKGNRMYAASPFDFNWLPYVSSHYGYRVHPTSGAKDYHKGIDIAVPIGTEIHAGHDGTVTTASYDSDGYGYYVVIEDGKGLVTKYAHCDTLLVNAGQTVKKGDVIAKSGNTGNSTGPHLHMEVIRNGQYLNPLYFAENNDTGNAPVFGDAGSPLSDGSYAALIAEAERHIGKAYVFGANGPNNFDCSSYVCWIFTHSGVKSMPRTTAYGIYTQYCTPISPSEAQPGDIIFFHTTYSTTSPISHVGLYVGDGKMIHAGNPIGYTSINSTYWQNHFFAFGRITP